MYTIGQTNTSALQRVRQQALAVFRIVNHYCPQFPKTKDIQQFIPCWQQIILPRLRKSLSDTVKIYILGSKLASLVSDWVRRFCTPKAQRGYPVFLKECWGRYPGEEITFDKFMEKWSKGQ